MKWLALALSLLLTSAQAQVGLPFPGPGAVIASNYIGLGDVISGAQAYWGLRAYSSATRGNRFANVCNSTGGVDIGCADMFTSATTGAVVPATISLIACPGANCTVKTLYDQSQANACLSTACDITQATVANRPTLNVGTSVGCTSVGQACLIWPGIGLGLVTSNNINLGAPFTIVTAAKRTGNFSTFGSMIDAFAGLYYSNAPNELGCVGNSGVNVVTEADSSYQVYQYSGNGTTIGCTVNTTSTSFSDTVTFGNPSPVNVGGDPFSQPLTGDSLETAIYGSVISGSMISAVNTNIHTYWGF